MSGKIAHDPQLAQIETVFDPGHKLRLVPADLPDPKRLEADMLDPAARDVYAKLVRRYLRLRRERDEVFECDVFADPAWDMILDLFAAECEGRRVCVTSACIAAAVPATTALRWIRMLEKRGMIFRDPDVRDSRRKFLKLSGGAFLSTARWIDRLRERL